MGREKDIEMRENPLPCLGVMLGLLVAGNTASADGVRFNRDIRPLLSDRCFQCHGPDAEDRKKDLRLDIPDGPEGALASRDGYFILKPGQPEESELWWRITDDFEEDRMPPVEAHKPALNASEIALFEQWILEGAEYQDFWAFIPPQVAQPPPIENVDWSKNPIDHWVMAHLEKIGLQPTEEADKRTLIRRVTFDLTGLPPTSGEISDFLSDDSPDAYVRLVDRLLHGEAYGEHMTRYWADLVRLSDTNGMHKDFHREFSPYRDWLIRSFNDNLPFDEFIKSQLAGDLYTEPSRDQLVASGFNRLHMIIDRGTAQPAESLHKNVVDRVEAFGTVFLGLTVQCAQCHDHKYDPITQKEYYQLYGFFNNFLGTAETVREPERGLQPPFINLTNPNQDRVIAGFNAERELLEFELAAELRKQNLEEVFPEKFSKIEAPWIWDDLQKNSSEAEFRSILSLDKLPRSALARFTGKSDTEVWVNGTSIGRAYNEEQGIVADISRLLRRGENEFTARSVRMEGETLEPLEARALTPEELEKEALAKVGFGFVLEYEIGNETETWTTGSGWSVKGNRGATWQPAQEIEGPDHKYDWTENVRTVPVLRLVRKLEDLAERKREFLEDIPAAMIMAEMDPPRQTRLLLGGNYENPGNPVERGTPAFLPPLPPTDSPSTRLDLAEWLVAPHHPLTARIAVNRFWQQFFGVGLVKTSEDFGAQGEWPSHPELLDYLAIRFRQSGWDVKGLLREIVLSKTYRQSSDADPEAYAADPENRRLARGSRYRMDAEMIRDQLLAVSGQLNRTLYGKSVKPPQPPGLWRMVSMARPFTYVADEGEKIYRRSLYTYWRRGMPPPQMTVMNAPSREFCVTRRERTNTPLQALLLMNEKEYFKAAKETAKNTLEQTEGMREGLSHAYEKVTSHLPGTSRLELMEDTLLGFEELYRSDPELAKSLTPEMEGNPLEKRIELAAWTMITHSLFNLELAKVRR